MEDENTWWNLIDVVQFILILLKVFGIITWSWFWVLTPLWIIIILAILVRD
jgi:membrane protein YdbS with pleckstrin-like domain